MHVLPRIPHGRSSGSVKLHSRVITLGQQGTEPDLRIYAVVHRYEVVVLTFAALDEGGISRPFCLDVLVSVQRIQGADELARTAYLCSLRVCDAPQPCSRNCLSPQDSLPLTPASISRMRNGPAVFGESGGLSSPAPSRSPASSSRKVSSALRWDVQPSPRWARLASIMGEVSARSSHPSTMG